MGTKYKFFFEVNITVLLQVNNNLRTYQIIKMKFTYARLYSINLNSSNIYNCTIPNACLQLEHNRLNFNFNQLLQFQQPRADPGF